jgi:hypothetical protein
MPAPAPETSAADIDSLLSAAGLTMAVTNPDKLRAVQVASEQVSQLMDDPDATAAERLAAAKQALIGALGLGAVGAAGSRIFNPPSPSTSPESGTVPQSRSEQTLGSAVETAPELSASTASPQTTSAEVPTRTLGRQPILQGVPDVLPVVSSPSGQSTPAVNTPSTVNESLTVAAAPEAPQVTESSGISPRTAEAGQVSNKMLIVIVESGNR